MPMLRHDTGGGGGGGMASSGSSKIGRNGARVAGAADCGAARVASAAACGALLGSLVLLSGELLVCMAANARLAGAADSTG